MRFLHLVLRYRFETQQTMKISLLLLLQPTWHNTKSYTFGDLEPGSHQMKYPARLLHKNRLYFYFPKGLGRHNINNNYFTAAGNPVYSILENHQHTA
jgi:hypothetical protein